MAHHSDRPPMDSGALSDLMKAVGEQRLGPTGMFPEGKMDLTDEGEIKIGITHQDGKVALAFGTPVAWIGFTPDQAESISALLKEHAVAARMQLASMVVKG